MQIGRAIQITCLLIGISMNNVWAQTTLNHNDLAADFYEADGDVAVILLHGTLAHNRMEIITTIATLIADDYGYPVLTPNLSLNDENRMGDKVQTSTKGYAALTACDINHTHKYEDAVTELANWVDYLKQQGYEKIVVAGHSRGGRQVSAYLAGASDEPAVVGGVLIASGLGPNERDIAKYKDDTGLDLPELLAQFSKLPQDQYVDVPKFIYCDNPKVTAGAFIAEYEENPAHSAPLNVQKVTEIPVLVIGGSEDTVVPDIESDFESLADQENVTVEVIDGADHFFRDLYADDVATMVADLIESI